MDYFAVIRTDQSYLLRSNLTFMGKIIFELTNTIYFLHFILNNGFYAQISV